MSLWNPDAGRAAGYQCPGRAGGGAGTRRTETVASKAMLAREWYSVAWRSTRKKGVLTLHQVPHRVYAASTTAPACSSGSRRRRWTADPAGLRRDARAGRRRIIGTALMNGKIDRPRLSAHALDEAEIRALEDPSFQGMRTAGVVGCGFLAPDGIRVDRGHQRQPAARPHAQPAGARDEGRQLDRRGNELAPRPRQYGAMHFHDDSVHDAGWETDFSLTVPASLRSGLYAAHLRCGDARSSSPSWSAPRRARPATASPTWCPPPATWPMPTSTCPPTRRWRLTDRWRCCAKRRVPQRAPRIRQLLLRRAQRRRGRLLHLAAAAHPEHAAEVPLLAGRTRFRAVAIQRRHMSRTGWRQQVRLRLPVGRRPALPGEAALGDYDVLVTSSHSEYWSEMWDAVDAFRGRGGRIISMGGNTWYWRVAFNPSVPGVMEVRRNEDPAPGRPNRASTTTASPASTAVSGGAAADDRRQRFHRPGLR